MKHEVIEKTLPSWLKIWFIHVPEDTLFNFRIYLNSWDQFTPEWKYEVSHILEHCLFEKNKNFKDSLDFKIEVERLWASRNWATSYNSNWYMINWVIEKKFQLIDLLLKQIFEAELNQDDFVKQKEVIKNELTRAKNDHHREHSIKVSQSIKKWLRTFEERLEMLDNVKFEDVIAYYEEFYVQANCTFLFSWNIKDDIPEIEKIVSEYFKDKTIWSKKELDFWVSKDYAGKTYFKELQEKTSFDFNLRFLIETEDLELKEQYIIFLNLFMSWLWSRIQNKAREMWLIYTLHSTSFIDKNYINIWFAENASWEKLIPLIKLIIDEMKDIFAWNIDDKEFDRAMWFLYWNLQKRYIVWESILWYYTDQIVYDDFWKPLPEYLERVKTFTKEDIVAFWKSFDFSNWIFSILWNWAEEKAEEIWKFLKSYTS